MLVIRLDYNRRSDKRMGAANVYTVRIQAGVNGMMWLSRGTAVPFAAELVAVGTTELVVGAVGVDWVLLGLIGYWGVVLGTTAACVRYSYLRALV
jgi:hypothetical protein